MQRNTLCFTLSQTSSVLYNDYTPPAVLLYISMTSCECLSVPFSIRPLLACLQSGPRNRPLRVLILTERHTPRDLIWVYAEFHLTHTSSQISPNIRLLLLLLQSKHYAVVSKDRWKMKTHYQDGFVTGSS